MKRLKVLLQKQSVKVTLLYILLSAFWIAFTDRIVEQLFQDSLLITQIQTLKGWGFVLVSGLFLFWIIRSASSELEENRDYYKKILDDVRIGIAILEEGRIVSMNPAFMNILRFESSTISDEFFFDQLEIPARDHILTRLEGLKIGEQTDYEVRFPTGSNRKKWVQFNFSKHKSGDREYFQIIVLDINDRKTFQGYNDLLLQLILSLEPGLDFESSLQRMLKNLCTELNWEYGIALTPGDDGRYGKRVSWYQLDPLLDEFDSRADLHRFKKGEGLTGLTVQDQKSIWIEDLEKDDRYKYSKETLDADLRTIVSIPVVINDEVLAVIMLFNRERQEEDPDLVKLLTAIGHDIASKLEKNREQDRRRKLEQSLNFALKSANMATWDMDLETGKIIRSLNHHELFGFEEAPETWTLDDFLEIIHSEDRQLVQDSLMEAAIGAEDYDVEFRMELNGRVRWFWSKGNLQQDDYGEPERLSGVITDITEKKKIEAELEREQELLESLYKTIPVMITIYRPDLSEIRVNKEFERVTGWTNEEMQTLDPVKTVFPDPDYGAMVVDFMSKPGSGWKDFEMKIKSGETIYSTWTNIRLSDETQIGIGLDITERKNYEMEIRNKEHLLREAQRVANLGTFTLDLKTEKANASTELKRILGFDPDEEMTLDHWRSILHPDYKDEIISYLERTIKNNIPFDKEYLIQRQNDGVVRWVHGKGELILNEEGEPVGMIGTIQDIDDRKRMQDKLRENEERLRLTTHSAKVGLWEWHPQSGKTILDEIWANLVGYTLEELQPVSIETWNRLLHPDDLEKFEDEIEKYFSGETDSYECEVRLKHKEGQWIWVLDRGRVVEWDEKNRPTRMVGTHIDITEKKRQEELLNAQKIQLQRAQNIARIGYWEYDIGSRSLIWSDMVYDIFGLDKELFELTLENFHSSVHPGDVEMLKLNKNKTIAGGYSELTYRFIKPDGELVYVQERGEFERRPGGRDVLSGTVLDITDIKKAEQKLQQERLRFEAAAGVVSDVIWDVDVSKDEVWWSEGIEAVFGFDREKVLSNRDFWKDHIYKEDRKKVITSLEKAKHTKATEWHQSYRFLDAKGLSRFVEDSAILIRDENGELLRIIGAMLDVTEQRKAEDRIIGSIIEGSENERRRLAKELHDGLGQYLAAASMNLESTYDDIRDIAGVPWEQYKKGLKLLDEAILESRRMSQNLLPKAIEDFGLSLATESMLDDLNESSDVEISYSDNIGDLDLSENIELNMYRIIQEGVNNAIKHSECSRLSVQLTVDEESLTCNIEDNGSGFAINKEKEKGLGLQSIRNRVKSMAGDVEFSSRLGKGTLISVIVPLKLI